MTDHIHARIEGSVGRITLTREKALNSLTTEMCAAMTDAMQTWKDDEAVKAVVVDGAGDRAFCAGGDIIMLQESGKVGDGRAEQFWRTEYALNDLIFHYPKPYIAMIDGIVMGGGVGLSVHGRHRIAGDTTLFAMPETGIGYFPDVGGTYFLPRLGEAVGNWLAMTGARLKTGDACLLGIANAYIPSDQHDAFIEALSAADLDGTDDSVLDVVEDFEREPGAGTLHMEMPVIEACFMQNLPVAIENALKAHQGDFATKTLSQLQSKSPLAVAVTFEAVKRGAKMEFRDVMKQELDLSLNFLKCDDFYEGIRAQVIDKDRNPNWSHESLADVKKGDVTPFFDEAAKTLEFLN